MYVLISLTTFFYFYSLVRRDGKVHYSAVSLFLLMITRSGRLAEIRWSVSISKSQRSLCVSFSWIDSGLCIHNLFIIIIYYYYYYYYYCFSHQRQLLVFHWSLSDCKSVQVSRNLPSVLTDVNNAVVWMVSAHNLISKSSNPLTNPLGIVSVAFRLMNAGSSNKETNHEIRGKRVIFTGTSIYKKEAVSNKNIGLVDRIRIQFTIVLASVIRSGYSSSRHYRSICCTPHLTGKSGTRRFFSVGPGAGP